MKSYFFLNLVMEMWLIRLIRSNLWKKVLLGEYCRGNMQNICVFQTLHFHMKWPNVFPQLRNIMHYKLFSVIPKSGFDHINSPQEFQVGKSCRWDMLYMVIRSAPKTEWSQLSIWHNLHQTFAIGLQTWKLSQLGIQLLNSEL